MKMLTLCCLTIILITTFTSLLYSETSPQLQLEGMAEIDGGIVNLTEPNTGNIFYQDPENKILLIDFKEVSNKLAVVKVTKENTVLMEDKVGDLAIDSIYEVDFSKYGKGAFTITLVTTAAEEITEHIEVE